MVKVKICGITRLEDALYAVEFGADALGFVFFKESPRYVSPETAGEIIRELPLFVTTFGVFVNEEPSKIDGVRDTAGLDVIQLHGDESHALCDVWPRVVKAFRVRNITDLEVLKNYKVSAYLLDAYTEESYGGTGEVFNWDIALEAKKMGRVILAGGLTPNNIEKAIRHVKPYAVDVSSGVEKDKGVKDVAKMKLFIENAKSVIT